MAEKIGEFLTSIGVMKINQVVDVLRAQRCGDNRLFGEIAIEFGYINDEVLRNYVVAKIEGEGRFDIFKQESDCKYRNTCLFYHMKNMAPSNELLKQTYCIGNPQKCAIYQAKSTGKQISITLAPTGNLGK